jgi:hypothetical protein
MLQFTTRQERYWQSKLVRYISDRLYGRDLVMLSTNREPSTKLKTLLVEVERKKEGLVTEGESDLLLACKREATTSIGNE